VEKKDDTQLRTCWRVAGGGGPHGQDWAAGGNPYAKLPKKEGNPPFGHLAEEQFSKQEKNEGCDDGLGNKGQNRRVDYH